VNRVGDLLDGGKPNQSINSGWGDRFNRPIR
jgi:hypothetical protein